MSGTLICPVCGKEFTPSFNRQQKYCGAECRKTAKKRKDREYYKERYLQSKKPKKEPATHHAQVKSRPLSSLSGDDLLHYGAIQQAMNAEMLKLEMPRGSRHE